MVVFDLVDFKKEKEILRLRYHFAQYDNIRFVISTEV